MILQETIDKVFALDIVEVIGKYVDLKRAGSNYKGFSPFTNERSPSFMVSPTKGIFKCFSSSKGGGIATFIMEKEMMNYPEAIRHLCKLYSIEFLETESTNEEKLLAQHKESLFIITKTANEYYKANLNYFQEVLNYVYGERQLTAETIQKFEIGFGPATVSGLTNQLINNGFNWKLAVEASVLGYLPEKNKLYDKFRNRVMFPIKNIAGNIIGFGGRIMVKDDNMAKYVNSSDSIIYNKSEALYGIYEAKKSISEKNQCLLTEGYLDVIMFHQKGVENTVASAGTALTTEQVKLIKRFTKNVVVMFDGDLPGLKAALRGIDVLLPEGMNVKVLILPDGQDPDDFAKARTQEQIENYISENAVDFVLFKLQHLLRMAADNIALRGEAIEDVVSSIAKMPSAIQREIYLSQCANISKINIEMLHTTLKKYTAEQVVFNVAAPQSFYGQFVSSKNFIQKQCERKILQYILAYGSLELTFKEVLLDKAGMIGQQTYKEVNFDAKRTVLDKVIYELENDGIHFLNLTFSYIYDKAKSVDLRDFNSLRNVLSEETFLLANEMRNEELNGNKNVLTATGGIIKPGEVPELHLILQNAIRQNLLFYKTVYIECLIEEESKKDKPNKQNVKHYIDLMIRIKKELNT